MLPDPIVEKYYSLKHKTNSKVFRGYACILQKGVLNNRLIFTTSEHKDRWFFWDEFNFEYIGDLA